MTAEQWIQFFDLVEAICLAMPPSEIKAAVELAALRHGRGPYMALFVMQFCGRIDL